MLELICEKIGVEIEEKWLGNDGFKYKINKDGILIMYYQGSDGNESYEVVNDSWVSILTGELKPMWKPKLGSVCYMPKIINETDKDEMYMYFVWNDSDIEHRNLENGLVYKTKEEALQCAKIILDAIK